MRPVLAPVREEPEDREDGWIIVAEGAVINPVSFKQFNQGAEKRLAQWYSGEGVGINVVQNRAI
jgi:hypothetical protein